MNSCEQIRTAMMAYDWIGFDLFDTLLLRPFLQPDDLFCQMEQELQVPDFAALRSQTENQLRQGRKRELTFLEIYQAIQQKTGVSDARNTAVDGFGTGTGMAVLLSERERTFPVLCGERSRKTHRHCNRYVSANRPDCANAAKSRSRRL